MRQYEASKEKCINLIAYAEKKRQDAEGTPDELNAKRFWGGYAQGVNAAMKIYEGGNDEPD